MLTKKFFTFLIHAPHSGLIIAAVLFDEGPLSRSDPLSGQSESWPDRGAPERSTAWWPVERWEALRLALGARGCLAARGGLPPRLKGARWCPGASHRSIPLAQVARGILQTSDASRRENR